MRESASRSGATHVLDHTPTNPSSRTLPRCESGLPRNTQNFASVMETFLNDHLLKKDNLLQSSAIQRIGIYSPDMRLDVSETARREMKRESLNTPIESYHTSKVEVEC